MNLPRPLHLATCTLAVAALSLQLAPAQTPAPTVQTLRRDFVNPPNAARPMVRWWWFGLAVVKPEILRELQQMKADGIQGAELAFEYPQVLDDPSKDLKNLPFLSPEMLDDVHYAQVEGRKLGLRIDVTLCSGWPYGGPHITLDEAVHSLHTLEVRVPANATSVQIPARTKRPNPADPIPTPAVPAGPVDRTPKKPPFFDGDSIISAVIADPAATTIPTEAVLPSGRAGRGARGPRPPAYNPATAAPIAISGNSATFAPADHARIAVFFIDGRSGQQVKRAAVGAEGFVLDSFSHEAVASHIKAVGEPLLKAFGATPPYAIFSDSLEAYGSDWTPKLPEEFKRRRGYDLIPHLAELVAGGTPAADKVRHDYGMTLTELIDQNYLKQMADFASAHHTKFRSQTYGEPAVDFSSQNIPQLAEGEGPQWRGWSTLRWASSANHVFNHEVTSGETFTWLHSPVFRATPLDMKTEADIDFIMGENQIVGHGWPYSPPDGEVPEPGWSLYAATSLNDHNPWHPVMPAVTAYIGRMSYLLRQGKPANQVAILLPTDDVWATFAPTHTTVTGAMGPHISPLMSPILSAGYNIDYIDAKAIDKVGLGTHQILILPATDRIPTATLAKLAAWAKVGGKIISVGRVPSMDAEGVPLAAGTFASRIPSAVLVPDEMHLADALHSAAKPDFQLDPASSAVASQLGFIRRKLTDGDIYFVANTSNQPIDTTASFATAHKYGEMWDPDSAAMDSASASSQRIHLAPYESRVFVFDSSMLMMPPGLRAAALDLDLSTNWKVNFVAANKSVTESKLTDWTADHSTLHYSGEAIYSRDFDLTSASKTPVFLEVTGGTALPGAPNSPPEHGVAGTASPLGPDGLPNPLITRTGPGMHAYYDPPIREAALVTINGKDAGALWHPPYRLDVSKYLKQGANHIEIHVYNTAINAWSALPPHDYAPLIAKYGDRFQMQDINHLSPIPSGILGKIELITIDPSK
jgi:hypothetical protein